MKDAAHLLRLAALFGTGMVLFLIARQVLVPATFGQYGHFRGAVLAEIRARPITFAGRAACEMCHEDQVKVLHSGKHAGVGCETCHGALGLHADDPMKLKPVLPDTAVLCAQCHEANSAKPKGFPQVVSKEHSGGEVCKSCHTPHTPKIATGA